MTFDSERGSGSPHPPVGTPRAVAVPLRADSRVDVERAASNTPQPTSGASGPLSIEQRWRNYWLKLERLAQVKRDVECMMRTPVPWWLPKRPPPPDWVWRDCRQ